MRKVTQRCSRFGFSLLEILLAIAILGGALAALGQIATTGLDAAQEARVLAMTRVVAQAKMSEVLLNAAMNQTPTPIVSAPVESFDSSSKLAFEYSVDVQTGQMMQGLLTITVTVQATANGSAQALGKYQLTRWMIDPAIGLAEAEAEEEFAKAEARGETEDAQ